MLLNDKVILVTDGASGIGRATSIQLGREGARVVIADRDADGAAKAVAEVEQAGGSAQVYKLDVADHGAASAAIDDIVATDGRLDGTFNNAGIGGPTTKMLDIDPADWAQVLAISRRATSRECSTRSSATVFPTACTPHPDRARPATIHRGLRTFWAVRKCGTRPSSGSTAHPSGRRCCRDQ